MYYKVLKDGRVIDVLDRLAFVKYQKKHGIIIACPRNEAQAIMSSNGEFVWHVKGLYAFPVEGCDTVELAEIDEYEYRQLKILNLKTPEEIIDAYTLLLIEGEMI